MAYEQYYSKTRDANASLCVAADTLVEWATHAANHKQERSAVLALQMSQTMRELGESMLRLVESLKSEGGAQ